MHFIQNEEHSNKVIRKTSKSKMTMKDFQSMCGHVIANATWKFNAAYVG